MGWDMQTILTFINQPSDFVTHHSPGETNSSLECYMTGIRYDRSSICKVKEGYKNSYIWIFSIEKPDNLCNLLKQNCKSKKDVTKHSFYSWKDKSIIKITFLSNYFASNSINLVNKFSITLVGYAAWKNRKKCIIFKSKSFLNWFLIILCKNVHQKLSKFSKVQFSAIWR